ncbi:hypothetical protein P171DRAFT_487452 [Karstenula rhodostoma CBS 690.94]|uniref:Uncharacterized protein n=1 Tax=Karstenula rhodostoma CBS 690.94 TaxID=1392251 RepID=A0A9P4PFY2_9PLEO|nr:hypothetical protein P171DRAFT_487452 [Karstenula rhodostoma CBS 690.94]
MSPPATQREEGRPVSCPETGAHPHIQGLKEHQKTTITMFTENGINPESIVKATRHGGVQNLLQEAERIVGVADAWQTLYGIDIKPLIQLYNKYGKNVVEVCLVELVHMSQQGLLQVKQDVGNEAMLAISPKDDDLELSHPTGKVLGHPPKPAGKRLKSSTVRTDPLLRPSVTENWPPFPSATASRSLSSSGFAGKRRIVGQVCAPRCPNYMKRQHFINHALLKHNNNLPSQTVWICCCDKSYTDDEAYLDHQWNQHSDILSTEESEAVVTPQEQSNTPCLSFPTLAGAEETG